MVNIPNGVPLLGSQGRKKPRIGVNLSAFVRRLDEDGLFEAAGVRQNPDGTVSGIAERTDYLSVEDLLVEIRQAVREEVVAVLQAFNDALMDDGPQEGRSVQVMK